MEESGDELVKWPYVQQTFKAGEVQSPINILSHDAYNTSFPSLFYFRYWRADSIEIKIVNNGDARKSVSFPFFKNKLKTNEIIVYFFSVQIHSKKYDNVNYFGAHITGGPLFENKYTFSHIHIYWGAEGEDGSEHQINSQG